MKQFFVLHHTYRLPPAQWHPIGVQMACRHCPSRRRPGRGEAAGKMPAMGRYRFEGIMQMSEQTSFGIMYGLV
jgi:hypothetical protein